MVQQLTLKDYLNSEPNVTSARTKLEEAKAALTEANRVLSGSSRASQDVINQVRSDRDLAQKKVNELSQVVRQAESSATDYFKKNYKQVSTSVYRETVKRLEAAKKQAKTPEVAEDIQATIDGLNEAIANPKPYQEPVVQTQAKGVQGGTTGQGAQQGQGQPQEPNFVQDINNDITLAGQYIAQDLTDAGRVTLAQELNKAYGLKLPTNGDYSPELKNAYVKMLTDRLIRSIDFGRNIPTAEFLVTAANEGTYKAEGAGPKVGTIISPRANATAYINAAFKQVGLNREATAEEIDSLTKVLNDAESRFRTTVSGGVKKDLLGDRTQFIANLIKTGKYADPNTGKPIKGLAKDVKKAAKIIGGLGKTAETLKADTRSLTIQSIQGVANSNGVTLSPQQLEQYALDVQNGKDVKVIQNQIRTLAGLGMPENVRKLLGEGVDLDTIYSPYRQAMGSILEINPGTIMLNDPVLRSAIGPNGEVSLYDFQRQLRKDPRWQYTNNAREEVSSAALQVLRDFGFQG